MYHVAVDGLLAVAFCGPLFALRRVGARWAILVALSPAALIGAAAAASLATAWGRRTPYGDWEITNAGGLLLSSAVVLVAGLIGLAIAMAWTKSVRRRGRRREP
jgi:hypothetical protein